MPALDISDRLEVTGMRGTPEGDRWALIQHTARRKRQDRFAAALCCQLFEFAHRSEILTEALSWNFGSTLRRSTAKLGFEGHPFAEEPTTECSVTQDRRSSADSVWRDIRLDCTLKEVA
jgi:hypothetical protein